jgi:transcriptional regulator with XRE-family HTH domain
MSDPSFGIWLRRERERRGATLKTISDQIKVSVPLLQGLETDDLSRWPSGIFRRAFVRAYATAIGLDPDDVIKRFERQHCEVEIPLAEDDSTGAAGPEMSAPAVERPGQSLRPQRTMTSTRARILGTAADLTVALVLGLGSAAADSRLLWPVLLIAAYYAIGVVLTGTSPMVALLSDPAFDTTDDRRTPTAITPRTGADRRLAARRTGSRANRSARPLRQRAQ